MSPGRRHRRVVPIVTVAVLAVSTLVAAPSGSATLPSVRLFAASSEVKAFPRRSGVVKVDPGVFITPTGDDFELRVTRPDYLTPFTFAQVEPGTGSILRSLPMDKVDEWFGLKDFVHYEVLAANGAVVKKKTLTFCPNSYSRQRISDEGPLSPRYPYQCLMAYSAAPFIKGVVWGIDLGWAEPVIAGKGYYGGGGAIKWRATRRTYTIRVSIKPAWAELLSIAPTDATSEVHVSITNRASTGETAAAPSRAAWARYPRVPTLIDPNPKSLPDLTPTPAYSIDTVSRKGHDYLGFASTEWNQGPGTMVVDGFRRRDDTTMDAFQYFLIDGQPIGRAPIGELEFHAGRHHHWHFQQFALYTLLDAASNEVVVSDKQSWCLVNTDALDLTVPNANLSGYSQDLSTACGGPQALWIREVLDVGWGDTYGQYVGGGAFDITDLPNGRYYIRIQVNPVGLMHESDTSNNIQDRLIKLRGRPGHRRVVVPPWNGIDTEDTCYFC